MSGFVFYVSCLLRIADHTKFITTSSIRHSTAGTSIAVHIADEFRQSRQLQRHKCRPENYASNVQKEMRQRNCRNSAQYIGPMFVTVPRHNDILDIVGDIFSHASDDDDTCNE